MDFMNYVVNVIKLKYLCSYSSDFVISSLSQVLCFLVIHTLQVDDMMLKVYFTDHFLSLHPGEKNLMIPFIKMYLLYLLY